MTSCYLDTDIGQMFGLIANEVATSVALAT
jgi:hypothetical protein